MSNWELNEIDQQLIDLALREDLDIVFCDLTTQCLFSDRSYSGKATLVSKHTTPIVLCGLPIINELLARFETEYTINTSYQDGDVIAAQHQILTVASSAAILLMAERTLLNFLRHLSAIATLTKAFVDKVKHTQLKILDTRKTTPGLRHLEKYAVHCGGGVNHRLGLYDAYIIKDTHVDLLGGMQQALAKLPEKTVNRLPVIVEVRNTKELQAVIDHGQGKVDRVLLDNMSVKQMRECVHRCNNIFSTE